MRLLYPRAAMLALCGLLTSPTSQAADITQAAWLDSQPKPAFKPGHTLPRLTRYAYALPPEAAIKFCEDWGYALEFPNNPSSGFPLYNGMVVDTPWRLSDPNSPESRLAALTKADPVRYPLQVAITQAMPVEVADNYNWPTSIQAPVGSYARNASGQTLYSGTAQQTDGTIIPAGPVWSLEAPVATWQLAGEMRAGGLRELQARGIPIAYILNGGEYGLEFWHNSHTYWEQDPRYDAGVRQSPWGPGFDFMFDYCSAKEAEAEFTIADAVKVQVPQRKLYVPYTAGGQTERNRFWGMPQYGGFWKHNRGQGDLPSNESYFKSNGDGFTTTPGGGRRDILTQALNAKALEIQTGNPLSYNWISAGWDGNEAEETRWAGFLKCYYTAGMIGCNVGAYGGGWQNIVSPTFSDSGPVPVHLRHMVISSHVHALFSQVDNLVRNGDLLPGPAQHEMSGDVPAYEFPTGEGENSRVLARKHRTDATWLITAWAATGNDRNVSVYIPELGQITLQARIVGSVYTATLANGNVTLTRIDNEGATYTAVANGTPVTTPVNLAVPSPIAQNRLLWLSADSEVTADGAGKVSSWGSLGNNLSLDQTNAGNRPTLVANAINGKPALRFVNSGTWMEGGIADSGFSESIAVFAVFTPGSTTNTNRAIIGLANATERMGVNDDIVNYDALVSNGIARKTVFQSFVSPVTYLLLGESLWSGGGSGFGLNGDIAEILVYKNISSQTAALVKEYLDNKYSLSSDSTLANGSFESPVVTGYRYTPDGGSWYFTNYSAIQANGSAWGASNAPNGNQTAVIQGAGKQLGSMSQTVKLAAGSYTLNFKAARRGGTIQPLKVMIDSTQIGGLITASSDAFQDISLNFVIGAGKHTIRFEATDGSGDKSTFIDQVSLTKIAAPTSLQGGSFETPSVSGYQYAPTGSGWNFSSSAVIQANGSAWNAANAPDGIQTAVLQNLGAISQTVSFTAGTYTVSYKSARRNSQIQPVKFSVDGTQVGNVITPASTGFSSYTTASFTVLAGEHVLRFEGTDGAGDNSTFIDQVALNSTSLAALSVSGNSFESPAMSGYQYNPTGSGWSFTSSSAIQANGSAWNAANAPDGTQTAVLQGNPSGLGAITQTLNFAAGTYTVSFKAARRGSQIQPVKVSVGGTQVGIWIAPTSNAFATYTTASFTVAAGNQVLRLEATDGTGDNSTFIDQVVVNSTGSVASFIAVPDAPVSPQVQPMRLSRSGPQRAIEYHRVTSETRPTVAETSNDLVTWVPVSTQPSLSVSSETLGPNMEKITISLPNTDTRRFFRLRIG